MKFEKGTRVNIVGNGVAGWISAVYLVDAGEDVVMYSDPNVVIRRIGESTIPVINEIATIMGVTDEELIDRSNGYFKYGNVFTGWNGTSWLYYPGNEEDDLLTKQRQTFSYHIDAPGFCQILQEWCETKPNFKIIPRNFTLEDYNKEEFFLDASGENGILSKHVGIKHIDSSLLVNDHAVVGNGPPIYKPYTLSQTMTAGWMWSISLKTRMSYGYVFSSKHQSIEDAKKEFKDKTGVEPENVIKFKSRRPVEQWVDNVVAVGISAGFIEPLNATANFIAQASVKQLIKLREKPKVFNRLMNKTFEGIYTWVRALYGLNSAEGDYWQYYRDEYREQALRDVDFYSVRGHQGLMSKHSWNLLKDNMVK
tara:strand:- start:1154 stop:2251 length:1098 start_codon:yes stop_codon:yes gene_type:complete